MADAVREIRDQITKEDLLEAIRRIQREGPGEFGPSTTYDLIHEGELYPPKQVVGYAAKRHLGRDLGPDEFEGGMKTPCFTAILNNGFVIRAKPPKETINTHPVKPNSWEVREEVLRHLLKNPAKRREIRIHIENNILLEEKQYELNPNSGQQPKWRHPFAHLLTAFEKVGYTSKESFGGEYSLSEKGALVLQSEKSNDQKTQEMDQLYQSYLKSRKVEVPIDRPPKTDNQFDSTPLEATTFLSTKEAASICELLQRKKNIILQGAPGTGKTYIARALAKAITGELFGNNYHIVQFHQTYAYEDFVEGYRPDGDGGFELRSGVFKRICEEARQHQDPVILVLDEINRGNLSKIFGELLVLLEADKRGPDHGVTLSYSGDLQDRFSIPENLYVIGTMNTADRSLALVDYALRRRFGFFQAAPKFASPKFKTYLQQQSFPEEVVDQIVSVMTSLNDAISSSKTLGPGFCIGHSFFCPSGPVDKPEEWYQDILENEIEPLIDEYCGLSGNLKDKLVRILRSDVD